MTDTEEIELGELYTLDELPVDNIGGGDSSIEYWGDQDTPWVGSYEREDGDYDEYYFEMAVRPVKRKKLSRESGSYIEEDEEVLEDDND